MMDSTPHQPDGNEVWTMCRKDYRLYLLKADGHILIGQFFQADDDASAIAIAEAAACASQDTIARFEVWDRKRLVHAGSACGESIRVETLACHRQIEAVRLEEQLQLSHQALRNSVRLLAATSALRDALAFRHFQTWPEFISDVF